MPVPTPPKNGNNKGFNWGRFSKTLSFWILIILIPVALIQLSGQRSESATKIRYDEYRAQVEAGNVAEVTVERAGYITAIDGEALGHAVVHLGGGRLKGGDRINPAVGLSDLAPLGEPFAKGEAIALVHAATQADADKAIAAVRAAYRLAEDPVEEPDLIHGRIG